MSDLISRKAVLESLETDCSLIMFDSYGNLTFAGERITEAIKRVPSVKPERKPGKWLLTIEDWIRWTCSECGFSTRTDIHVRLSYKYCPNCGAKMREVQDAKDINVPTKLDDFDRSGEEWR